MINLQYELEFAKKAIIQSQLQFMCGSNFYETDVTIVNNNQLQLTYKLF